VIEPAVRIVAVGKPAQTPRRDQAENSARNAIESDSGQEFGAGIRSERPAPNGRFEIAARARPYAREGEGAGERNPLVFGEAHGHRARWRGERSRGSRIGCRLAIRTGKWAKSNADATLRGLPRAPRVPSQFVAGLSPALQSKALVRTSSPHEALNIICNLANTQQCSARRSESKREMGMKSA